jgi:hypothetical protein
MLSSGLAGMEKSNAALANPNCYRGQTCLPAGKLLILAGNEVKLKIRGGG